MKVTSVYITLADDRYEAAVRSKYQMISNYLTLHISDWIKAHTLDLGSFNRIIFEEGDKDDLSIAGDRAYVVCLSQDFAGFKELNNAHVIHDYFTRKYLEGFAKLDGEFSLNLTAQLSIFLNKIFHGNFEYEILIRSKKNHDYDYQVLGRYRYDQFDLIVRKLDSRNAVLNHEVIFSCLPDPFVVDYDVHQVLINSNSVRVTNKVRDEILVYNL